MKTLDCLIADFQQVIKNEISEIENVLIQFFDVENGIEAIQKTVRNYRDGKDYGTEQHRYRYGIIKDYIIPFCKKHKINITKKHLKTL